LDCLLRDGALRDRQLCTAVLVGLDREDFFKAWATSFGIEPCLDRRIPSLLPEQAGTNATGRFWVDERGLVVYRCSSFRFKRDDGTSGVRDSFSLTEVYQALRSGRTRRLGSREQPTWKTRWLVETFGVPLPDLGVLELGDGASDAQRRVRDGVHLLFRVRGVTETPNTPTPLARGFLARWCGVSESVAEAGKLRMIEDGVIYRADEYVAGGRRTTLWKLSDPPTLL
jgi:hypothetical protein